VFAPELESAEPKNFCLLRIKPSPGTKTNEQKFFASFFQKRTPFFGAWARYQA
jgi:hypothetical protein